MSIELLGCPFCGHEASYEEVERPWGKAWSVGCRQEGCIGYQAMAAYDRKTDAAAAWNKRAALSPAGQEPIRIPSEVLRVWLLNGIIENDCQADHLWGLTQAAARGALASPVDSTASLSTTIAPLVGYVPVKVLEAFFEDWEFTGGAEERVDKLLAKYRGSPIGAEQAAREAAREIVHYLCANESTFKSVSAWFGEKCEQEIAAIIQKHAAPKK